MYRIITVAREFGSGGSPIAEKLASRLGWELLDNALIERIAKHAQVSPSVCAKYDEQLDSWVHRLSKQAFGRGAFEGVATASVFDGDTMAALARQLIEEPRRSAIAWSSDAAPNAFCSRARMCSMCMCTRPWPKESGVCGSVSARTTPRLTQFAQVTGSVRPM